VLAESSHTHQGQLSLEEVAELGQFVYPQSPHHFPPGSHPKIVFEFSAFLQVVGVIHIFLQVFAVGMHGAEFLHVDHPAVFAKAFETDEGTVGGVGIRAWLTAFFEDEVHQTVDFTFMDQIKPTEIEAPQHLGFGKRAGSAFGHGKIPALQDG